MRITELRSGGGKAKGSSFERLLCKQLSLWVTNGKKEDCFWRSAISGGRATVAKKKGQDVRQAGDICSVSPEGHALTDHYFIEAKFYRDLQIDSFLLENKGNLAKFWKQACKQADSHNRLPMLIAKQNQRKPIVLTNALKTIGIPKLQTIDGVSMYLLSDVLKSTFFLRRKGVERFRGKSPIRDAGSS